MLSLFIRRPVMAISMALLVVFTGLIAMRALPVSQFPDIAPPRVTVTLSFPGASADVLVESAIIPIERAINGVPGMRYLVSDATSAGEATLQVLFNLDVDPLQAMMDVKTRLDTTMSRLPNLITLEGIWVQRVQPSMLMYINLFSRDEAADQKFLFNYAYVNVIPELQRVNGIAQAKILGSRQYAMRIWLNPERMRAYQVSTEDVMKAIGQQSIIGRPGRLGQSTGVAAQSKEYVLVYQGRYKKPEQYRDIIIRATSSGEILHLGDIATVDLSSEFYNIYSDKDSLPSASIVLNQNYGTNARAVIDDVKVKLEELKARFPEGMDYEINYDVSRFLDASIHKVIHTLAEAFLLVALVTFLFLGDLRSTLIPILSVPVSLIGTFAVMQAFGLSINLITLFALVLAIGIVVDDAIVVVEAVHTRMAATHLPAAVAARQVLGEIGGAILAITLIMVAVFVPIAFMKGPIGVFYRQFGITMASAILISALVALTLTPVLCALILKDHAGSAQRKTPLRKALDAFNQGFDRLSDRYLQILERFMIRRRVTLLALVTLSLGMVGLNELLPSGFIPEEDQGMIYAIIQTPPGSTLEMTNKVAQELETLALDIDGVQSVSSLAGYEVLTEGRGSNAGTCIINLKDWALRQHSVKDIIEQLEARSKDFGAVIEFFEPPAVPGYGASSGLALRLLDRSETVNYQAFDGVTQDFLTVLRGRPELTGLFTFYAANYPQYEFVIDNKLAMQKHVSIGKAMENLDIMIGSTYEQGFIRFNNFFKVYVQALPEFRRYPSDILNYFVKNEDGDMVPYSAFMTLKKTQGPNEITRYNLYNSAVIRAAPAPGFTSGEAIAAIQEEARKRLPADYDIAWEGLSYDEASRGDEALLIFGVVLLFVYLILAAQYESFVLPFAVLFSLPAGLLGSLALLEFSGLANDVYAQIGMIMLIGLLGKNAVLIVEYGVQRRRQGRPLRVAALEAAKARFRPILMTSLAFIAGLIPLVTATGAGALGNRTIGSASMGGMLLGTSLGVLLIPGLFVLFTGRAPKETAALGSGSEALSEDAGEP